MSDFVSFSQKFSVGNRSILQAAALFDHCYTLRGGHICHSPTEIQEIQSKGVKVGVDNFIISESANLILPFHRSFIPIYYRWEPNQHTTEKKIVV